MEEEGPQLGLMAVPRVQVGDQTTQIQSCSHFLTTITYRNVGVNEEERGII